MVRTLSPLPSTLLSFDLLHNNIKSLECSSCNVNASISVVDIRIRASRCAVCNLLRRSFFIRFKLENPRSQSTLVAGKTAIIRHKLQLENFKIKVLDKILISFTEFNIDNIIHELCLIHILHVPIFVHQKVLKLINNGVCRNKPSKLIL